MVLYRFVTYFLRFSNVQLRYGRFVHVVGFIFVIYRPRRNGVLLTRVAVSRLVSIVFVAFVRHANCFVRRWGLQRGLRIAGR